MTDVIRDLLLVLPPVKQEKKLFMKWMKQLTGREDGEFSLTGYIHSVSVWQGLTAVLTNRCDSRIILFIQQPTGAA